MTPVRSASAVTGTADLSRGVDFEGGELARLDGTWELYRDRLLVPEDFRRGGLPAPGTASVPGHWGELSGLRSTAVPATGMATLRLVARVPPRDGDWALRIPNADTSVRVYVNGDRVAEIGRVSDRPADCIPSNGIAFPRFRAPEGVLEIVMQVANYSAPLIGTWDAPILGDASAIMSKRNRDVTSTSIITGALFIMGLYHLGLFLLRKKDLSSLLFGVICLSMALRNQIMGERLFLDLLPVTRISWELGVRLEHLSAHMVLPLFALFLRQLFPRQIRRLPVRVIVAGGLLWAALVVLAPAAVYLRFLHWFEYFLLASGLFVLGSLVVAVFRREKGAGLVVGGLVVLLATVVNDVLLSVGAVRTFYMASYGVFFYVFTQSFHLSMIFSKAFRDVEELSMGLLGKNRELESLHIIDLAIASSEDRDAVLGVILEQAVARLSADAADILLFDAKGECLSLGARTGFRSEALVHTKLRPGEGFAGQALQSDRAVLVMDLAERAEGFSRSPAFSSEGFVFYAGRRLTVKGKIQGVLELYRRSPLRKDPSWELYFETLAGQAAVALDNSSLLAGLRRANEDLQEANEAMIEGWAEALELRDRETEGHSRRVTAMTLELAKRFGITDLESVRNGALLHDIGKLGIPDSILLKPGALSEEEFQVMRRHPVIARELLSRLRFLDDSLDIPFCHHEKWDGSGYPRGLAGELIPLPARLFAVIDVWDALRSDRPYRKGWPEERVLEHIASLSGSHFDPDAARRFIELRREMDGRPEPPTVAPGDGVR